MTWLQDASGTWLQDASGFERVEVVPGENRAIADAELRLDAGMITLGSAANDSQPAMEADPRKAPFYVTVDDPDAHCGQAHQAGAEITAESADTS